jgi:FkbM family methyltransferase
MSNATLLDTLQRFAAAVYEMVVPKSIRIGLHNRWFVRRSASWEKIRNTPDSLVTSVGRGLRMRLYGDSLLCEMLYAGTFEAETRGFFEAFLRPGDCFLDVGANVGLYALAAARIIGRVGQVHAFEPCTATFQRLRENVRLNRLGNVSCHQLALSHENASAELTLAKGGFDAWNSLGSPYMGETGGRETVTTRTLDSFAREHGLAGRITAIKIDVEGWENQVLTGAEELLAADDAPILCVEFTEEAAQLANSSCLALYQRLERLGYRMYSIGSKRDDLQPFPARDPFPHVNLLATKNLAAVQARLDGAA